MWWRCGNWECQTRLSILYGRRSITLYLPINLHKHIILRESKCLLCKGDEEFVTHILWECLVACNVWALIPWQIKKQLISAEDFLILSQMLFNVLSKDECEVWATTKWSIWHAQSEFLHARDQTYPSQILDDSEIATRVSTRHSM